MTAAFRVLGTLAVSVRGRVVPLPAGHGKVVLAGLLLHANEVVPVSRILHWLFGGAPPNPDRAAKTVHMVMNRLRKALGEANVVATAPGGYMAVVRPDQLDLARFRSLVASGEWADALSLWRGPVLTDVVSETLQREEIAPLAEERLAALEARIADDLAHGRHASVVSELRFLTGEHPARETFWAHLILALHRDGQSGEAREAYLAVTRYLASFGTTPSQDLRDLHQRILTGAADLPVPHQLPAVNPHFAGRSSELELLDSVGGGSVVVIDGTAGVGKTTLAVSWCHAVASRFPGGQLHVNLRGFDPHSAPARPVDVLRGFLDALQVADVPSTVDACSSLFRSVLADRKVLVLLDNARDVGQVLPLLPSSPGCLVVVTSRNRLSGLESARLTLSTLTRPESEVVLARHLGVARLRAEPEAVRDLVSRCAGLPLALAVVAARAATTPFSLRDLADELAGSLDVLSSDDSPTDVRAVFSWSYQQLSPAAARLFRLFGVPGGGTIGVHALAALAGGVGSSLAELVQARLLEMVAEDRFGCHDLLAAYAAELAELDLGRSTALDRLLDYYLHCADLADALMPLPRSDTDFPVRHRPSSTPPLDTPEDAMAWFDVELSNVIGAIELAAARGRPTHAHQLTYMLSRYLWLRADWSTWLRICLVALPCTEGVPEARMRTLFNISAAHHRLGSYEEALRWASLALPVAAELPVNALNARALTLSSMGHALLELERYDEAEQRYQEAALVADQPGTEAQIRHNLARLLGRVGRHGEAEEEFTEAFPLYEKAGHHVGVIDCHYDLAEMRLELGHFAEAQTSALIALGLAREHGSRMHEATSLEQLGDALDGAGAEGAPEHWEQALEIFDELGTSEADRVRGKLER
ncbi:BTAD domain-containing putative transcriptional regulator [Lentzea sp. NPDC051838]|uniref:AfsR/SARP family transcriptional regulator n=1 Tax=Lentzea sp. NPDC051838 TaxID=3154849 RepID=UPI0034239D45